MPNRPLLAAAALIAAAAVHAAARSTGERHAFQRENPCPATGQHRGGCPGYVIDHIYPLCAGGADHRSNMQWQTTADGLVKDRWERQLCRKVKAGAAPTAHPQN